MRTKIRSEITIENILAVVGAGLVVYGTYLVYAPAAFLVAGALLLTASYLYGRNKS